MLRRLTYWICFVSLIIFCLSVESQAAKKTLDDLGIEILESLQSFYPVKATEMGIHAYDHRLADYSSNSIKQMTKILNSYEKNLYKYKKAELSLHDRINYKLLKSDVDIALLDLKQIKWHQKSPQLYVDEAVNGIYFLMLSNHAPLSEKVVSVVNRMKAVPSLFRTARKNLKKPPPVYVEIARESLESGIQFYKEVAAELMNKFPERADEIAKVSTKAREAMNDFLNYLAEIKTGEEKSFAIGKKNLDYKLTNEYYLDYDSDSLLKIGENLLEEIQMTYRIYEKEVETNHQNGRDSVFVPANFTKQDILDYYNWETDQVRIFVEQNDFITIPENIAPVTVVETPSFLQSMIHGIAYQPAGPFDSIQHGYFYVRPIPDNLDREQLEARFRYIHRRGFKGSVVHEAFPGHHLQFQIAGLNDDPIRKWHYNIMLIEGWALYCEEMMYKASLYGEEDPARWLAVLGGIRFRAARIIADVKLHTGQFTYQECVDWMVKTLDVNSDSWKSYIETEVRRYTLAPTIQMAYLMGKREIMRLKDSARQKYGDDFNLKDFHDALLAEGSIPPTLMWEIMELEK